MFSQLEKFAHLKPGWLEGKGGPFDIEDLRKLASIFHDNYPLEKLDPPYTYPLDENKVVWEWEHCGHSVSLDITMGSFDASWFDYNVIEDEIEEQELNLLNTDSWSFIINKLSKLYADEQQTIQN